MAHVPGITPDTSVTMSWSRPICIGSTLLTTVPRYFPKYCFVSLMAAVPRRSGDGSSRRSSCRHALRGGDQSVPDQREVLLVLAALDGVGDALHVVEPVERG